MGWENKEGQLQTLRKQSNIFYKFNYNKVWKLWTKVNSQISYNNRIQWYTQNTKKNGKQKTCEAKDFKGLTGEFYCLSPFSTHLKT